jgi:hypothetical protein
MPGPYTLPTDRATGGPSPAADMNAVGAALNESASAATPSVLVLRDAAGRAKFAAPSADDDAATKAWVLSQIPAPGGGSVVAPAASGSQLAGLPGRIIQNRADTAHVSNRVYLTYFYTPVPITLSALVTDFFNVTGTGGKMRVAVYEALDMATPGDFVTALGNITFANANIDQAVTPVVLPAGAYFLAQHSDWEGTITAVSTRVHKMGALAGQDSNYQQGRLVYSSLASGAAWPTNLAAPTLASADLNQNGIPEGYVMIGWSN